MGGPERPPATKSGCRCRSDWSTAAGAATRPASVYARSWWRRRGPVQASTTLPPPGAPTRRLATAAGSAGDNACSRAFLHGLGFLDEVTGHGTPLVEPAARRVLDLFGGDRADSVRPG